jgi:hypothetical protein
MQSLYCIHYIHNRRDSLREASDFNNGAEPCRPQSANPQAGSQLEPEQRQGSRLKVLLGGVVTVG